MTPRRKPAPETIGQRIKRLRAEKGFSQRELSSKGVSYAYISRIEAGERMPSVKALRMLAAKLDVSAHYLEHGFEDPKDQIIEQLTHDLHALKSVSDYQAKLLRAVARRNHTMPRWWWTVAEAFLGIRRPDEKEINEE